MALPFVGAALRMPFCGAPGRPQNLRGLGLQGKSAQALEIIFFLLVPTWTGLLECCQMRIASFQGIDLDPIQGTNTHVSCALFKGICVEHSLVGCKKLLLLYKTFLCSRVDGR